ncbi:MAG: hypothetical protein QXV32_07340 [Conexivisphaerales archaeon]
MQLVAKLLCSIPVILAIALAFSSSVQTGVRKAEETAYLHSVVSSLEKAVYDSIISGTNSSVLISPPQGYTIRLSCSSSILSVSVNDVWTTVSLPADCNTFAHDTATDQTIFVNVTSDIIYFSW